MTLSIEEIKKIIGSKIKGTEYIVDSINPTTICVILAQFLPLSNFIAIKINAAATTTHTNLSTENKGPTINPNSSLGVLRPKKTSFTLFAKGCVGLLHISLPKTMAISDCN